MVIKPAKIPNNKPSICMTLIIHEMLIKRQDKATQHNRKKKQHNITHPKQLFFKEKVAPSGGTYLYVHANIYDLQYVNSQA